MGSPVVVHKKLTGVQWKSMPQLAVGKLQLEDEECERENNRGLEGWGGV